MKCTKIIICVSNSCHQSKIFFFFDKQYYSSYFWSPEPGPYKLYLNVQSSNRVDEFWDVLESLRLDGENKDRSYRLKFPGSGFSLAF